MSAEREFEVDRPGPLIPEGEYRLRFEGHETRLMFGEQPKVILRFTVANGEHFGAQLRRFYNASRLIGQMGAGGMFKAKPGSDFMKEYAVLTACSGAGEQSLAAMVGTIVVGHIRSATHDPEGKLRSDLLHYSVVAKLTGRPTR